MDTYGDMVTLILTFFVLLYSMSSIDQQKWQYIAQAFASMGKVINTVVDDQSTVENPTGNLIDDPEGVLSNNETDEPSEDELPLSGIPENFDQLYQYLKKYVEENDLSDSVSVDKGAANVFIRFKDNIFFNPDSSVLRQEGIDILNGLAPGIEAVDSYILGIRVNGYTAEAEFSSVNDRDLSSGRANAVLKYLEGLQISPNKKLSATGYGKYRPVAPNDTEENRAQNRRVEIIIARNDVDYSNPTVIQEFFAIEYGQDFVQSVQSDFDAPDGDDSPADSSLTDPAQTAPASTEAQASSGLS